MNRASFIKMIVKWRLEEKLENLMFKRWLYKGGNSYQDNVFYCETINKKYFERERKYYHKYTDGKDIMYKFKKRYKALIYLEILLKIIVFFIPLASVFIKENMKSHGYKKIKD